MESIEKKSALLNAAILVLVMVLSAVGGWIYELIFYRLAWGIWGNRGTSLGPWIPIYGFGALLILFLCYRFKKNMLLVFTIGGLSATVLEYFTGLFLYKVLHLRLWDYNTEPWNFLNIGGYVCFRSALIFCFFALLLVYVVVPLVVLTAKKLHKNVFVISSLALGVVYAADILYHAVIGLL